MSRFQVICANIGTVYSGTDARVAIDTYNEYVELSKSAYGRAAGEAVTLFEDNEITREHYGDQQGGD